MTVKQRERDLIAEYQAGSRAAADELCRMHFVWVRKCARSVHSHDLETDDLIQAGMIQLLLSIRSFDLRRETRLLSFCGRSILHAMWRCAKQAARKRNGTVSFDDDEMCDLDGRPFDPVDRKETAADVDRLEIIRELADAIRNLPSRQREVVRRTLAGQSRQEIGAADGVSRQSVYQVEMAGRRRLRSQLAKFA